MRVFYKVRVLIVSVVLICVPHFAIAQTLNAGITEWEPYYMYDGTDVTGVAIDILQEVSIRTGYTITYQQLSQKRMLEYFREKIITLEPACNPAWREADKDISRYTIPFMQATNVVLMKKESGIQATRPQDFRGKVLGCDLGYTYADGFEEEFNNGAITRDDTTAGAKSNLQKLAANRVDGIIIDSLVGWYWIKKLQMNPDDFEVAYTFQSDTSLSMRLHFSQEALLPTLNKTLEAMKSEGSIEKITAKYTQ